MLRFLRKSSLLLFVSMFVYLYARIILRLPACSEQMVALDDGCSLMAKAHEHSYHATDGD